MGAKADHDLWGHALAVENRYGDRGPEVLGQRIANFHETGELAEAAFWSEVATCLKELHSIRFDVPTANASCGSMLWRDRGTHAPVLQAR